MTNKRANSTWTRCYERQIAYLKSLPKTGPVTVLLDEPDGSLDITNQIAFWRKVVPMLKEYQVIIATHSPFLFTMPTPLNIIDIQPGYSAECRTMLKELEFDPFKL